MLRRGQRKPHTISGGHHMTALVKIWKDHLVALHEDESGATMVEYSILIGLITVAAVAAILLVGTWIGERWDELVGIIGA
jgi:pilus assembly protein Flp/PilA